MLLVFAFCCKLAWCVQASLRKQQQIFEVLMAEDKRWSVRPI